MFNKEGFDLASSVDVDLLSVDMPLDLIKESIKAQIQTLDNSTNYVEVIIDKFREVRKQYEHDTDFKTEIDFQEGGFYAEVKAKIEAAFNIHIDVDPYYIDELRDVTLALYYQLVLRFESNLYNYVDNYISIHRQELTDVIGSESKKDVTSSVIRRKMKNRGDVSIVANLPKIVDHIVSLETDTEKFLDGILANTSNVECEQLLTYERQAKITGNLGEAYMDKIRWDYPNILNDVKSKLFHDYEESARIRKL